MPATDASLSHMVMMLAELRAQGEVLLDEDGVPAAKRRYAHRADLRYRWPGFRTRRALDQRRRPPRSACPRRRRFSPRATPSASPIRTRRRRCELRRAAGSQQSAFSRPARRSPRRSPAASRSRWSHGRCCSTAPSAPCVCRRLVAGEIAGPALVEEESRPPSDGRLGPRPVRWARYRPQDLSETEHMTAATRTAAEARARPRYPRSAANAFTATAN